MADFLAPVYNWAVKWSRIGVIASLLIVLLFKILNLNMSLNIQLVLALVALLVGIPHGAIDHLISIPRDPTSRFITFIAIYVFIAVIAGVLISTWNVNGFRAVLLMSSLHFGFGDASFSNERRDSLKAKRLNSLSEILYAIPAGFLPVLLPLTDSRTTDALERIHPGLTNWAGGFGKEMRAGLIYISIFSLLFFMISKNFSQVIDLLLLAGLSVFAPPLVAFASYFGFWHALRHTARLVPKLEKARNLASINEWKRAILGAITPGLYAVVGTLFISGLLMFVKPEKFSSSLLWSTLLVVWALTVPHMIVTARFDLKALKVK